MKELTINWREKDQVKLNELKSPQFYLFTNKDDIQYAGYALPEEEEDLNTGLVTAFKSKSIKIWIGTVDNGNVPLNTHLLDAIKDMFIQLSSTKNLNDGVNLKFSKEDVVVQNHGLLADQGNGEILA